MYSIASVMKNKLLSLALAVLSTATLALGLLITIDKLQAKKNDIVLRSIPEPGTDMVTALR